MNRYIANFKKFQPLLEELVSRDIKIKYRRSVLGVLWTLLNPLLMMIVLSVVFSNLFRFDVENFPLYLLSGQVVFNFYNDSTNSAMAAIMDNASLIRKIYVPKYLFVLSRIFSSFINLLASFTALILVMIATRAELHWTVLFVPIPLFILVILSLGIGLFLSAVTVKFRDVALMYMTPVIYPMSILPSWLIPIVNLNPLTNILEMFRNVMFYNKLIDISDLLIALTEAIIVLVIGLKVFYDNQDEFILRI